jgi:hypothetical protein
LPCLKTTIQATNFSHSGARNRTPRSAVLLPLIYFVLGLAVIPQTGLQDDELLFSAPYFHVPDSAIFSLHIFHTQLPLMQLTYLGALKSWLFLPILAGLPVSYLTIRLPALATGSLTIWLFFWLLERTNGRIAAWIGGILLATDTMFLFTTCFDWGPVVLQHLLAVAGMALLVKFIQDDFIQDEQRWALFLGFLCFGLALWDKALFAWFFSGLIVAAVAVFPREVWARLSLKNVGLAAAGLCVGALPLIAYNAASDFATLRANSSFDFGQLPSRLHALGITWDGEILWGYMAHAPWSPGTPLESASVVERVSAEVHTLAGFRYHNALVPAFWLAVALTPLLWFTRARKTLLFCLIAMAVAWFQMAITKGAGDGAHHVMLLWPLPHWFLAVAFTQASQWKPLRWRHARAAALAAAMVFLGGENLLLTNEYFYQLSHFAALASWSDAIYRLSDDVARRKAFHYVVNDWGIVNELAALNRGMMNVSRAGDRTAFTGNIWIGHTRAFEQQARASQQVMEAARAAGFKKQLIETVRDRSGQPVFEIFQFVRVVNHASGLN